MGTPLTPKEAQKQIQRFSVPTRPTVLLAAIKSQNVFVQNVPEVTEIILRDVALSARMLQSANTLVPGCARKVESIEWALALLGQDRVREITQELFLSAEIARRDSWMQKMRTQSVRAARTLSWLSRELATLSPHMQNGSLPIVPHDEAYAAGLFHDCGKMVLLKEHADYPDLLQVDRSDQGQTLEGMEWERYRVTHAQLGALLCDFWQLPKPLVHVVEVHHRQDAFAGRSVRERKYVVLHSLLLLTEWIEGDLLAWEWERHRAYVQQLFALDAEGVAALWQKGQAQRAADAAPID